MTAMPAPFCLALPKGRSSRECPRIDGALPQPLPHAYPDPPLEEWHGQF